MEFVGGDFGDRVGESDRASGLFDLVAEVAGQDEKLGRGQVGRVAFGDLAFDAPELFAERVDAVGDGGEPFFREGLQFDGLEVEDLELVFATPSDEGRFGDVEFGTEARIGPAAGAQFDEALDGLFVVHSEGGSGYVPKRRGIAGRRVIGLTMIEIFMGRFWQGGSDIYGGRLEIF